MPPATVSLVEFVDKVVAALKRRGLLRSQWFAALLAHRPLRAAEPVRALLTNEQRRPPP